jgi:phosphoserine phosphatase
MTRRLCVLDVESTVITSEVLELLNERAGKGDEAAAIAEAAALGDLDASESLRRRVATLEGLPVSVFDDVLATMRLTPGAENLVETLHANEWVVGLVSEGFTEVIGPLAARLGITRYRANGLEVVSYYLTGRTRGPVIDGAAKEAALREFAEEEGIPLSETVAIGGDESDLAMLRTAGLGIAFNAKPVVVNAVNVAVTSSRLDAVLDYLEP